MLVQDRQGLIRLLPALPEEWPEGSVNGLRGREGVEIDLIWRNHRIVSAEFRFRYDRRCRLKVFRENGPLRVTCRGEAVSVVRGNEGEIAFDAIGGESYTLDGKLETG
ncbi:glycoside hydrolase family 95-like protein [Cohnella rhizosphaerae]